MATAGEKELKRKYPNVSGLVAGTTKQEGTDPYLKREGTNGIDTTISKKDRVGL